MSLLNRAQVLHIKQYHMRHGIHAKSSPKGNAIYISLLLFISNGVHPHPGPPRGGPKYPCGVCRKAVRWSSTRKPPKAVACDACDVWYHTDCMGMNSDTYEALNQTNVTWICANCDTSNHSSLLDSHIDACINSFSPLSCIDFTVTSPLTRAYLATLISARLVHPYSDHPRFNQAHVM